MNYIHCSSDYISLNKETESNSSNMKHGVMCCFFFLSGSPAEMSPSALSPVSHGLGKVQSISVSVFSQCIALKIDLIKGNVTLKMGWNLFTHGNRNTESVEDFRTSKISPPRFLFRPSACHIQRASFLVLYSLLWAKPAGWRDVPRLTALSDRWWLHRPLQLRTLLLRASQQRQPKRDCWNDEETYRYEHAHSTHMQRCAVDNKSEPFFSVFLRFVTNV